MKGMGGILCDESGFPDHRAVAPFRQRGGVVNHVFCWPGVFDMRVWFCVWWWATWTGGMEWGHWRTTKQFQIQPRLKKSHLRLINQILHVIFVIQYYNAFEFKWIFILLTQWGFDSNSERYNWGSKPAKNELRPPRASWIALHFLPAVCSVLMSYSQRTLR